LAPAFDLHSLVSGDRETEILTRYVAREIGFYKPRFEYTHSLSEQVVRTVACNQFHLTKQCVALALNCTRSRRFTDDHRYTRQYEVIFSVLTGPENAPPTEVGAEKPFD
jgi:hypothetical protein